VGCRSPPLYPASGRQDHVGLERGFGDEQVLHRQTLEFRQRLAGVLQIGNRKSRDFRRRE